MSLPRTVSVIGLAVAFAAGAGAQPARAVPGSPADAAPVLTSTPFGARQGQRVTHTITLAVTGSGTLGGVRVTFTTSAGLDAASARTSVGRCPTITAVSVICDLGDLAAPRARTATPTVTVRGVLMPGAAPGSLVQNVVALTTMHPDADPADNVVSNAYLLPGAASAGATARPPASARPASAAAGSRHTGPPVLVALISAALVAAAGVLLWRRLRRRPVPTPP